MQIALVGMLRTAAEYLERFFQVGDLDFMRFEVASEDGRRGWGRVDLSVTAEFEDPNGEKEGGAVVTDLEVQVSDIWRDFVYETKLAHFQRASGLNSERYLKLDSLAVLRNEENGGKKIIPNLIYLLTNEFGRHCALKNYDHLIPVEARQVLREKTIKRTSTSGLHPAASQEDQYFFEYFPAIDCLLVQPLSAR